MSSGISDNFIISFDCSSSSFDSSEISSKIGILES
jgi:hypothetical protein